MVRPPWPPRPAASAVCSPPSKQNPKTGGAGSSKPALFLTWRKSPGKEKEFSLPAKKEVSAVEHPLLSIGMIVKNEIRCIEKCLKALQPLREAIPCELVIADTGSDDGTR